LTGYAPDATIFSQSESRGGKLRKDTYLVEAVLRACELLAAFRYEGEVLRLRDLVSRTGLNSTTAFRLLYTLQRRGLVERVGNKEYRSNFRASRQRKYRLGYSYLGRDSVFVQEWSDSIIRAAAQERIELVALNHERDPQTALRNADVLVKERVDLVIEYLLDLRTATANAAKYKAANIPLIALGAPRPGAIYYGPNNYVAGVKGGRYLGNWARRNWHGRVDELMLLDINISGPVLEMRMKGVEVGLRQSLKEPADFPVVRLHGNGEFERSMELVRAHLRHCRARRVLVGAAFDPSALGALLAFEEAGRAEDVAVVSLGGCIEGRMELRKPNTRLIADVAFCVEKYGENVMRLALEMLDKRLVPSAKFTELQVLTPANVDHFYPNDCLLDPATRSAGPVAPITC
jgi:ribose transport system substrate-binding protein